MNEKWKIAIMKIYSNSRITTIYAVCKERSYLCVKSCLEAIKERKIRNTGTFLVLVKIGNAIYITRWADGIGHDRDYRIMLIDDIMEFRNVLDRLLSVEEVQGDE